MIFKNKQRHLVSQLQIFWFLVDIYQIRKFISWIQILRRRNQLQWNIFHKWRLYRQLIYKNLSDFQFSSHVQTVSYSSMKAVFLTFLYLIQIRDRGIRFHFFSNYVRSVFVLSRLSGIDCTKCFSQFDREQAFSSFFLWKKLPESVESVNTEGS